MRTADKKDTHTHNEIYGFRTDITGMTRPQIFKLTKDLSIDVRQKKLDETASREDLEESFRLLQYLAHTGFAKAQNNLALFIIPSDTFQAVKWLERAAEQGYGQAMANLALLYLKGDSSFAQQTKGVELAQASASKGSVLGYSLLGRAYYYGLGVERDDEMALGCFLFAADRGDNIAQNNAGLLLRAESPTEAVTWFRRAVRNGNTQALSNLGSCYDEGIGVKPDPVKSLSCHFTAAVFSELDSVAELVCSNHPLVKNLARIAQDLAYRRRKSPEALAQLVNINFSSLQETYVKLRDQYIAPHARDIRAWRKEQKVKEALTLVAQ